MEQNAAPLIMIGGFMPEGFEEGKGKRFYRCLICQGVVSEWDIATGGCKCGAKKITPTNLTLREKLVQIWKHPALWRW